MGVESVLCSDVALALVLFGGITITAMGIGLLVIALPRRRFSQDVQALTDNNPLAFITPDIDKFRHSFQTRLPRCGVVMPVKGVHDQSYENWRAQITSMYGGPLEFFFCVESESDPACPHIKRLIEENKDVRIWLLVAGVSWHCSQKIHNQLHGFERAMRLCEYVIVIDDDIKLHPGTIRAWVEEMDSDPKVLAATGYAFEYVGPEEYGWSSYFAMIWRLNASCGFNEAHDRPPNCWGGAMMFRSFEMRENVYGLMDAWRDGGYSEDFITLSMARYHGRSLAAPKAALFPNQVGGVQFHRFWNFLCRQIFVLTQTHALGAQRAIAIGQYVVNGTMHACIAMGGLVAVVFVAYAATRLAVLAAVDSGGRNRALLAPWAMDGGTGQCAMMSGAVLFYWICLLMFGCTGLFTLRCFAHLCNVLSPHGFGGRPIDVSHVSALRLSVAYLLYSPLIPLATLVTLLRPWIIWSGVRFHVTDGRVSSMHRQDSSGEWYTIDRTRSLETAFRTLTQYKIGTDGILGTPDRPVSLNGGPISPIKSKPASPIGSPNQGTPGSPSGGHAS